jgi:hypothetical protein
MLTRPISTLSHSHSPYPPQDRNLCSTPRIPAMVLEADRLMDMAASHDMSSQITPTFSLFPHSHCHVRSSALYATTTTSSPLRTKSHALDAGHRASHLCLRAVRLKQYDGRTYFCRHKEHTYQYIFTRINNLVHRSHYYKATHW